MTRTSSSVMFISRLQSRVTSTTSSQVTQSEETAKTRILKCAATGVPEECAFCAKAAFTVTALLADKPNFHLKHRGGWFCCHLISSHLLLPAHLEQNWNWFGSHSCMIRLPDVNNKCWSKKETVQWAVTYQTGIFKQCKLISPLAGIVHVWLWLGSVVVDAAGWDCWRLDKFELVHGDRSDKCCLFAWTWFVFTRSQKSTSNFDWNKKPSPGCLLWNIANNTMKLLLNKNSFDSSLFADRGCWFFSRTVGCGKRNHKNAGKTHSSSIVFQTCCWSRRGTVKTFLSFKQRSKKDCCHLPQFFQLHSMFDSTFMKNLLFSFFEWAFRLEISWMLKECCCSPQ